MCHASLAIVGDALIFGMHGRIGRIDSNTGLLDWTVRIAKLNLHDTVVAMTVMRIGEESMLFAVAGGVFTCIDVPNPNPNPNPNWRRSYVY